MPQQPQQLVRSYINLGMSGYGKTRLMRLMLNERWPHTPRWDGQTGGQMRPLSEYVQQRLLILDPTGDPSLFDLGIPCHSQTDVRRVTTRHHHFRARFITSRVEDLEFVCREAFRQRDCLIVIDEAADFMPASKAQPLSPWMSKVMRKGRHEGIQVIATAQRVTQLHNDFFSQCNVKNIFRQELQSDVDYLVKNVGPEAQNAREFAVGQYLRCSPGEREMKSF